MYDLPELGQTIPEQMMAIKDKLGIHKRRKQLKGNLDNMNGAVDRLLKRAFLVGNAVKPAQEPDDQRVERLINTMRRGWKNYAPEEKKKMPGGSESFGINQINTNSPDLNIF